MLKALTAAALLGAALAGTLATTPAAAQDTARIEWKTFHSPAIEGNLEGNSATRGAYVITPPGYDEHPDKHYPVVYFLHGYTATPQTYQEQMHFDDAITQAAKAGNDLIMVVPDGDSKQKGAFYSSSPTVGDYETFVARDLIAYVDGNFRTIATRASRGLAGHSMGGYGTIRIAMKHPEMFSSIYLMSACCLQPMVLDLATAQRIEGMSEADVAAAGFGGLAPISTLVAWSPDPADPGFLKADTGLQPDGTLDPLVNYRIAANSPTVLIPQYLPALNSFEALAMDIGDADFLLAPNAQFRAELDRFGVAYGFELYEGDHTNRIPERIRSKLLPFFGAHLDPAD